MLTDDNSCYEGEFSGITLLQGKVTLQYITLQYHTTQRNAMQYSFIQQYKSTVPKIQSY